MLVLKPTTSNDFAVIEKLAHAIWHKHYITIISQEQIDFMLDKMYSFAALQRQTGEGHKLYIIVNENEATGFISISSLASKQFILHKFYILQGNQSKGLGTLVFKKVMEELCKPETIRLTVNRQNYKSINFYFKLGFKIEKAIDLDVGGGFFMNDFVMLWQK